MRVVALALALVAAAGASAHEADLFVPQACAVYAHEAQKCVHGRDAFRRDFIKALEGDAAAQRAVAYAMSGAAGPGALGALIEPVAACAWRMVVLEGAGASVGGPDFVAFEHTCGSLTPIKLRAAELYAEGLKARVARGGPFDQTVAPEAH